MNMSWVTSSQILSILKVVLTLGLLVPGGKALQCIGVDACMCQFDDRSGTADLTTCGNSNGDARYKDYTALYDAYLYSYNPCYSFTQNLCTDASMCQSDYNSQSWKTGDQSTTTWSYDGTNLQIYYYAETDVMRESFITAICDKSYTEPFVEIQGEETAGMAQYYGRITTICACPDGCHTTTHFDFEVTISGGWILVIIVMVLGFMYIVGGVLYMRFVRQASGREMIPNSSFWGAIPGLIKDGFGFTIGLCRGGGSGFSSKKSYQSI